MMQEHSSARQTTRALIAVCSAAVGAWRGVILSSLVIGTSTLLQGCQDKPAATPNAVDPEAQIQAILATLAPEDRRLAEQQKLCPIMPEVRLGEMGPPQKAVLQGETFFLCCRTCEKLVRDDPAKALEQLKQLKEAQRKEVGERVPAHAEN